MGTEGSLDASSLRFSDSFGSLTPSRQSNSWTLQQWQATAVALTAEHCAKVVSLSCGLRPSRDQWAFRKSNHHRSLPDLAQKRHGGADVHPKGTKEGRLLKTSQKLGKRHLKSVSQDFQRSEAGLFLAILNIRNERPSEAGVNGHVILRPLALPAELADSASNPDANVFHCHATSMAVFFGLYFAYRIQAVSARVVVTHAESPFCNQARQFGHPPANAPSRYSTRRRVYEGLRRTGCLPLRVGCLRLYGLGRTDDCRTGRFCYATSEKALDKHSEACFLTCGRNNIESFNNTGRTGSCWTEVQRPDRHLARFLEKQNSRRGDGCLSSLALLSGLCA